MAKNIQIGKFVEFRPQSPTKSKPQVGLVVGMNKNKEGKILLTKIYVRSSNVVVGVPPTALKVLDYPAARQEGNLLVTGRGLKISLKTGYPI